MQSGLPFIEATNISECGGGCPSLGFPGRLPARSNRTPRAGMVRICFFLYARKRKQSTTQQHSGNNESENDFFTERNNPVPSDVIICCPPLSRPPRHRFGPGKAFLPLCSQYAPSPASRRARCSLWPSFANFLSELQLVCKNKHRLKVFFEKQNENEPYRLVDILFNRTSGDQTEPTHTFVVS